MRPTLALLFLATLLPAADPAMSTEQRDRIVQLLLTSQQQTNDALKNVTDEQWKWKPAAGRWSIGEVAEHIALAEGLLFARVEAAVAGPINPDWEKKTAGKTEFLEKVMPTRTGKAKAPDEIVPEGKMTRTEVEAKFAEVRTKTLAFARETQTEMNARTAEHPFPIFNTLSAYQWLIYIPWHNQRHLKQIEEVKATPGYPAP